MQFEAVHYRAWKLRFCLKCDKRLYKWFRDFNNVTAFPLTSTHHLSSIHKVDTKITLIIKRNATPFLNGDELMHNLVHNGVPWVSELLLGANWAVFLLHLHLRYGLLAMHFGSKFGFSSISQDLNANKTVIIGANEPNSVFLCIPSESGNGS